MSPEFIQGIVVFVLAAFVGFEVISKVPPTLHTPLMSGANAISGITIVGAIIAAAFADGAFAIVLGILAMAFATINVVGGFLVTDRMLEMFKKKPATKKQLKITQVKSKIGFDGRQRKVLKGLGLGRIGKEVVRVDEPCIRGMVAKVSHLVTVEEVEA